MTRRPRPAQDKRRRTRRGVRFWMRASSGDTLTGWSLFPGRVDAWREDFEADVGEALPSTEWMGER